MNYKNNINRFTLNLNTNQHFVYENILQDLREEWVNLPKTKQKTYYKLYRKLLKVQIKQTNKVYKWTNNSFVNYCTLHTQLYSNNSNTLQLLNEPSFYKKMEYNKYNVKRIRGYTSYNEKVLDFKSLKKQLHILSTYKKLKKYLYKYEKI